MSPHFHNHTAVRHSQAFRAACAHIGNSDKPKLRMKRARVSHVSISLQALIEARREHLIIAVTRSDLILLSSPPPLL